MHVLDLLTPSIILALILFPLVHLERWIHQHLYGVGWLLTQNKERATLLYYLVFLPGVFLHETTQWLTAGALKIRAKKVKSWPKPQNNGTLRLDFVQVQKAGHLANAVVGLMPFLAGLAIVLFISQRVFDVQRIPMALSTGEMPAILIEFERLFAVPDFWLWLYLLFVIGNTMLPTVSDRAEWPFILGILSVGVLGFLAIGLEEAILVTVRGPITLALDTLARAFSTILVLDLIVGFLLAGFEALLQRVKKVPPYRYARPVQRRPEKALPGGDVPLPANETPKRITERKLPIPPPPKPKPKSIPTITQTGLPMAGAYSRSVLASDAPAISEPARSPLSTYNDRELSDQPEEKLDSEPETAQVTATPSWEYQRSLLPGDTYDEENETEDNMFDEDSDDDEGDDELRYEPLEDAP